VTTDGLIVYVDMGRITVTEITITTGKDMCFTGKLYLLVEGILEIAKIYF
jgi:hypothetical protein